MGNSCVAAGAASTTNPCQVCDPNRSTVAFSVNAGALCGAGAAQCSAQDTCNAQGQCVANNVANGTACTSAPRGSCLNGECVAATLPTGSPCTQSNECASGRCENWYRDSDRDGFGTDDDVARTCSSANGLSLPPNGYVRTDGDCCDLNGQFFPGQAQFFDVPQGDCPDVGALDYNCTGDIEYLFQGATERGGGGCSFSGCNGAVWTSGAPLDAAALVRSVPAVH